MTEAETRATPRRRELFLLRWRIGAVNWYGEMLGPGLLGEFNRLRVTLRVGVSVGGAVGALAALSGSANPWMSVPGMLVAGPVLAVLVVAVAVGVLTFCDAVHTTWINPPERRLRRLAKRIGHLEHHLESSPPAIANIPARDALLGALHDELLHAEILHRALPGRGVSVLDLSRRMVGIADEEHERVRRHVASPEALIEAGRIIDVPTGPALVCVFERRGVARATQAYALALHVLLRRYALTHTGEGALTLLVEAPAGFSECMALDGWLPRGNAVGPVDPSERETMLALWAEGTSHVYTEAGELLEAAQRL